MVPKLVTQISLWLARYSSSRMEHSPLQQCRTMGAFIGEEYYFQGVFYSNLLQQNQAILKSTIPK